MAQKPVLATDVQKAGPRPQFGPGSRVNWDVPEADPNNRKHFGVDPDGKLNAGMNGAEPDA